MSPPTLYFATVPGFYAAVERGRHPEWRGRPVVVGGDPRKRGQVQSATPDAAERGVREGMPVLEALERCPRARAVRTDMKHYRDVWSVLQAGLRSEIEALEPAGLGSAWLDGTRLPGDPEERARRLRRAARDRTGLDLRVGIAPVKFVARLAAEEAGEGGVLRVAPGGEEAFLAPLPVTRLPGVGPRTAARLAELGARTVADLRALPAERVEEALGHHGLRVLDHARARDPSGAVRATRLPRSLSQEQTFERPQRDRAALEEALARLARGLEEGLLRQGLGGRRVAVRVQYADGALVTRSRTLSHALAAAGPVAEVASALLDRTQAGERPVRRLGVSLSRLARGAADRRQLDLFPS